MELRIGPIVGEVTDSTARILVQPSTGGLVEVTLTPPSGAAVERRQALGKDQVYVFEFAGLAPTVRYALATTIDGKNARHGEGSVSTKSTTPSSLHMLAVSCNYTTEQGDSRLWERAWEKWVRPGTVSTVLHVGDQIYGDTAFENASTTVRELGQSARARQRIRQSYQELYHWAWTYPATRAVLANASNLMIWDDHEIRNSWGGYTTDRDSTSDAYFIGSIARGVFQEYQSALWRAPDPGAPHDGHAHAYGELGLLFLDQRTGRSFAYSPERPYLGVAQWNWLREELRSGALSRVRALVLVTSVPLCYVGTFTADSFDGAVSDLRDHWTHPNHRTELIEMLAEIRQWLRQPSRTLLVVGGDVHVGGRTSIEHRADGQWAPLCQQLITSPVTNEPPNWLAWWGLRELLLRGVHEVNDTFRFDHEEKSFTNRRNFAVLTLKAAAGEPPVIHSSLEIDADD